MGIAIAIGFVFLIFFSGGAWAQGPQAGTPQNFDNKLLDWLWLWLLLWLWLYLLIFFW